MKIYIAIATLVGMIVGAGILGLPAVFSKAGILAGTVNVILLGIAMLFVNLYLGEISLRTNKKHQVAGYVKKYFGKKGKYLVLVFMLLQSYGGLTAYILGEGSALSSIFGGDVRLWSLVFFIISAYLIYRGLKSIGKVELILTSTLVGVLLVTSAFLIPTISSSNYLIKNNFFLPYGVVLFSLYGLTSIPLLKEELGRNKKQLKKAIIIGSLIPPVIYIIFAIVTVGVVGDFSLLGENEQIASVALAIFTTPIVGKILNILAVLAMGTSFLATGTVLKELYEEDFNIKKIAIIPALIIPFLFFLIDGFVKNLTNFIGVIGFTGAVSGSLLAISIIFTYHKAKGSGKPNYELKERKWLSFLLIVVFLFGMIYSVINFFN